jgi:hypothetical protein
MHTAIGTFTVFEKQQSPFFNKAVNYLKKIKVHYRNLLPKLPIAHAEEIFYTQDTTGMPTALTEDEHRQVYPLLIKYTFPSNTHDVCKREHKRELTQAQIRDMLTNEHEFLQKQLAAINSKFKSFFVATTLVELFYYKNYLDTEQKLSGKESISPKEFWQKVENGHINAIRDDVEDMSTGDEFLHAETLQEYINAHSDAHKHQTRLKYDPTCKPSVIYPYMGKNKDGRFNKHREINDEFLKLIIQKYPSVIKKNKKKHWYDFLWPNEPDSYTIEIDEPTAQRIASDLLCYAPYCNEQNNDHHNIIKRAIKAEYDHHKTDYLIYRGTNGSDSSIRSKRSKKKVFSHSLSYGKSLFAGALFDSGATAFRYIKGCDKGYAVRINKENYYHNNTVKSIFFIPPGRSIFIHMRGETFHPRSKILPNHRTTGIFWDGIKMKSQKKYKHLLTSDITSPEEFERKLQDYLEKNSIPLKN